MAITGDSDGSGLVAFDLNVEALPIEKMSEARRLSASLPSCLQVAEQIFVVTSCVQRALAEVLIALYQQATQHTTLLGSVQVTSLKPSTPKQMPHESPSRRRPARMSCSRWTFSPQ